MLRGVLIMPRPLPTLSGGRGTVPTRHFLYLGDVTPGTRGVISSPEQDGPVSRHDLATWPALTCRRRSPSRCRRTSSVSPLTATGGRHVRLHRAPTPQYTKEYEFILLYVAWSTFQSVDAHCCVQR